MDGKRLIKLTQRHESNAAPAGINPQRPDQAHDNATSQPKPSRQSSQTGKSKVNSGHHATPVDVASDPLTTAEIERIFSITADLESEYEHGLREPHDALHGKPVMLTFREAVAADRDGVLMAKLFYSPEPGNSLNRQRKTRASAAARAPPILTFTLGEYADVIVVRANRHAMAVELARNSDCPVINGLTRLQPSLPGDGRSCTSIRELLGGRLKGRTLAWIGDANNVSRDVALGCGKLGLRFDHGRAAEAPVQRIRRSTGFADMHALELDLDPLPTRSRSKRCSTRWRSYRRLGEHGPGGRAGRAPGIAIAPYQVNAALMAHAPKARSSCTALPARRVARK